MLDLIEIGGRLGARDVGKAIVVGARVDIAIAAGDVAEAAGVDPQRAQGVKCDARAPLAFGGHIGVAEFLERRQQRGVGHSDPPARTLTVVGRPSARQGCITLA